MAENPQGMQAAPLWTVGVPQQTTMQAGNKGFVPAWDIPVILADKTTFTVQIPADQFTPEAVKSLIEDHVDRLVAVRSLTGPTY